VVVESDGHRCICVLIIAIQTVLERDVDQDVYMPV
jgi:hypothetical protein